jgi:hypothetical protein
MAKCHETRHPTANSLPHSPGDGGEEDGVADEMEDLRPHHHLTGDIRRAMHKPTEITNSPSGLGKRIVAVRPDAVSNSTTPSRACRSVFQ